MPYIPKPIDRYQVTMDGLDTLVPWDSMARVIDCFVDHLDLKEMGFTKTDPSFDGRPCFDPASLLKLFFSLFPGFEKTVKDFLKALIVRNPNNVDEIEKHSIFFQLCDERSKHDAAVWVGMEEAYSQALYDQFFPTFSVNKSDTPFVLPISGSYGFMHNGIKHINLPIDPWTAITLIDKKKVETIIKDETVHLYLITKDKHAEKFNTIAYENQQRLGYGRIVSNRKDVLEKLINI